MSASRDDTLTALADVAKMLESSKKAVRDVRWRTNKRVMMSGCIDLMHSGHVACFADAAK